MGAEYNYKKYVNLKKIHEVSKLDKMKLDTVFIMFHTHLIWDLP